MKIIVNQHIKDGKIQEQWANVHGSNHRPHRIKSYSTLTESSLVRIVRNAVGNTVNHYSGEEGQGCIIQTTFRL